MENNRDEDLRTKLKEVNASYQHALQQTYYEALQQNEAQTKRWEHYQTEHKELSERLLSFRDELSLPIMVPFGKKALMRGSLVHTNEILVCLGDGWFAKRSAKQAADICQRRIQDCDEMLKKLQKERDLITSRKSFFSFENESFGTDQTQEVIEPYDEEEEKKWRERHRQKEKEYHQKVAELKKAQKNTEIKTEDDLWKRLDALDLQEELEDELNRMEEDIEDEEEEEGSEEDSDSSESVISDSRQSELSESGGKKTLKRRVSFKEHEESCEKPKEIDSFNNQNDDMIRIVFKHSDNTPSLPPDSRDDIITPSDIYNHYVKQKVPKSILKSTSLEDKTQTRVVENTVPVVTNHEDKLEETILEPVVKAFGEEVVERKLETQPALNAVRPVSKFKAARMANKK